MRGRETSLSRTGFPADGRLVFLRFFEVKRLHAVKMPGVGWGVWDVTGVTGDRSWNVHSKGRVR